MSAAFFAPDVCRNTSFKVFAEGDFITRELALQLMETHFDKNTETLDLSNLEYTHIDENAFAGKEFEKIKVVILPKNCQFVNKSAFKGLQLEKVVFPPSIFGIGIEAFADCCKLKEVNFIGTKETPSRLCWIKYGAFNNTGIEEISIPGNCSEIGARCFSSCENLEKVTIPPSVELIGDSAFGNCEKLKEVIFIDTEQTPSKLREVGVSAFSNAAIENILMPDGCYDICKKCFESCKNLKKVTIPDTVFSFKKGVFKNCNKLECIDFKNKTSGTITTHCDFENFQIPDNIVSIEGYCFYGNNILNIKLPKQLLSIGKYAFAGTNVESIECNEKLGKIDKYAFMDCEKLTQFNAPESLTVVDKGSFHGCSKLVSACFPASTLIIRECLN